MEAAKGLSSLLLLATRSSNRIIRINFRDAHFRSWIEVAKGRRHPPLLFSVVHPPLFLLRSGALVLHPRSAAILRSNFLPATLILLTLPPAAFRPASRIPSRRRSPAPVLSKLEPRDSRSSNLQRELRADNRGFGNPKPEAGNRAAGIWHPNSEIENGTAVRAIVRTVQRKNIRTITERSIEEVKEVYLPTD